MNTHTAPTTNPTTTSTAKPNPVKDAFATVHGIGEKVRGEVNKSVDSAMGETAGVAKNDAVAAAGENEINTGHFSAGTKNREGVVPGDGERRY